MLVVERLLRNLLIECSTRRSDVERLVGDEMKG